MVDQEQKTEMKKREAEKDREGEAIAEAKAKVEKPEIKVEEDKPIEKEMEKIAETEEEGIEEKPKKVEIPKGEAKTEAVVNGSALHISTKHAIAICNFIRGKHIEKAIVELEDAKKMKFAIPMRGEIPHKKGIMSGRYPVKALGEFIILLKSLKANAIANELELEKVAISCKANIASRPYRRFGRKRFKRTHVEIKLVKIERKLKRKSRKIKKVRK
jgi:large subunit ribosomal protein L22